MRRFATMIAIALACSACNLFEVEERPFGSAWWVKNSTDRALEITPPPYGSTEGTLTLAPGESARLYARSEYDKVPYFGMVLILWRGRVEEGDKAAFEVRSAEGDVLRRWTYRIMDSYDPSGRWRDFPSGEGFFDEKRWAESSDRDKKRKQLCEWTFEITESDIAPQP